MLTVSKRGIPPVEQARIEQSCHKGGRLLALEANLSSMGRIDGDAILDKARLSMGCFQPVSAGFLIVHSALVRTRGQGIDNLLRGRDAPKYFNFFRMTKLCESMPVKHDAMRSNRQLRH